MRGRLALATLLCSASLAAAQSAPADHAFQRGREALGTGKYAEACSAFEESNRLSPSLETRYNIALCSEQLGKLATALALHQELARSEVTDVRRARSADRVDELAARVARARFDLRARGTAPAGVEVLVDSVRTFNLATMPLDPGVHVIVVSAPGYETWTGKVTVTRERQTTEVAIDLVPSESTEVVATLPTSEPTPGLSPTHESRSHRRPIGIAMTVGGGALLVGSLVVGALARMSYDDAKASCGNADCATTQATLHANMLVDKARTRGNIATAFAIGGAAIGAGGLVLWLTAPRAAERRVGLKPTASTEGAGLALVGRF